MRSEPLAKFANDLVPYGRLDLSPDHLQIGDCVLRIPPLQINVKEVNDVGVTKGIRQRNAIITKSGRTETEIVVDLWFNDLDDINGIQIQGPGGRIYYVDGLRPLIAHFRRTPIVPVFNELLNDVHNIYTVALSNLTVSTVSGFPGALQARLVLRKSTIEPYMLVPDYKFADYIVWPVFRWYYQQLLNNSSVEYLRPIANPHMTEKYKFSLLDVSKLLDLESGGTAGGNLSSGTITIRKDEYQLVSDRALMPARVLAQKLGYSVHWKDPYVIIGDRSFRPAKLVNGTAYVYVREVAETLGFSVQWDDATRTITITRDGGSLSNLSEADLAAHMVDVELPEDLYLKELTVAIGNNFARQFVQMHTTPCHQFLGAMEKQIVAVFETENREAVSMLRQLIDTTNDYSVRFRDKIVSGFLGFKNELTALFGIENVIVNAMEVDTVPGYPGLFEITVSMVEFDKLQRAYERIHAIKYIDQVAKQIISVNANDLTDLEHACIIEELLDAFDLYPDLDLPTYAQLEEAIKSINQQRSAYGLPALTYKPYMPSVHQLSPYCAVDPDFYIDYSYLFEEKE